MNTKFSFVRTPPPPNPSTYFTTFAQAIDPTGFCKLHGRKAASSDATICGAEDIGTSVYENMQIVVREFLHWIARSVQATCSCIHIQARIHSQVHFRVP